MLSFTPQDTPFYTIKHHINFDYVYVDNQNISYQQYNYRLVAYDDNGNYTSSPIIDITPMPVVVEGKIGNLSEIHSCDSTLSPVITSQINSLNSAATAITNNGSSANITNHLLSLLQSGAINVATYQYLITQAANKVVIGLNTAATNALSSNKKTCFIKLRWAYKTMHDAQTLKFEIYRAVNNYTFDLYKTINFADFSHSDPSFLWEDTGVQAGRRYSYRIVAINPNNTQSRISNMITVILN